MRLLSRPWSTHSIEHEQGFSPDECLLGEYQGVAPKGFEYITLLTSNIRGTETGVALFPYPKRGNAESPRRSGFPLRPNTGKAPSNEAEEKGVDALRHMNEVLARIQEFEQALEDPKNVWGSLRDAWKRAENEADPKMAEIVRQARLMQPVFRDLERRIRRVLRRHRELTPLDRVQEMDRASMVWLSRQPGGNVPERAGSSQRILATVRRENFDTLENRVLHAYSKLASEVAREWMLEHPQARLSSRFGQVSGFAKTCKSLARTLRDLGVMVAHTGITPNYVLLQDRSYRDVHQNWLRLLSRKKFEDDLWAWQAETWTDFAVLAITLAIDELDESELIAQSPISWKSEAVGGRWFDQDRPIAVFRLRNPERIVEIQSRPENPGALLCLAKAHVALRISDPNQTEMPRRIAVWTPHAMDRLDLSQEASQAAELLHQLQSLATHEVFRHGIILTPARGRPEHETSSSKKATVKAVAIGPSGSDLAFGFEAIRAFVRSNIYDDKNDR